jgi:protein-tyrosine phosphatase
MFLYINILLKRGGLFYMNDRLIILDGAVNFRDLGGYVAANGRSVCWQKIYRSDRLDNLTMQDMEILAQKHIVTDCDLRTSYEQSYWQDRLWDGVAHYDCHIYNEEDITYENQITTETVNNLINSLPVPQGIVGRRYQKILLDKTGQMALKRVFQEILSLDENDALVFHCTAGKDRTGLVAAVILLGLGVKEEDIIADYLLSNELYLFSIKHTLPTDDDLQNIIERMNLNGVDALSIQTIIQTINQGFGGFDNYFLKVLNFSKADLSEFRNKLTV